MARNSPRSRTRSTRKTDPKLATKTPPKTVTLTPEEVASLVDDITIEGDACGDDGKWSRLAVKKLFGVDLTPYEVRVQARIVAEVDLVVLARSETEAKTLAMDPQRILQAMRKNKSYQENDEWTVVPTCVDETELFRTVEALPPVPLKVVYAGEKVD